jgi:hypothetical protein
VARVRQNAWSLSITVPGTLRAELVDAVLPRLLEAARSAPAIDSTAAVRWVEQAMLEPRSTDCPEPPSRPSRNSRTR